MTTSDRIRMGCLISRISQKELAEKTGYHPGSVRDAISKNKFSFKMLVKIEEILGEDLGSKEL